MSNKPLEQNEMSSEPNNMFKLTIPIAKSFKKSEDGVDKYFVKGLASGVSVDLEGERMAETAIAAFKTAIDNGIVKSDGTWGMIPLRSGHRNEWDDVLGWVTSAEVDSSHNLWIEAELDENCSKAMDLYKKLTIPTTKGRTVELGLSVAGSVISASEEVDASTFKRRRVFNEVALKEISVVSSPAYPTAYVEATKTNKFVDELSKSVDWDNPPFNLGKDIPVETQDKLTKTAEATASDTPNLAEKAVSPTATEPEASDQPQDAPQSATPAVAPATPAEKSVEPDFSDDIKRVAASKKEASVDPEILAIVAEKKAAKSTAQEPVDGDPVAKDVASDALEQVDDAMDVAVLAGANATYTQLESLISQAKTLLSQDTSGDGLVGDALNDAVIASVRQLNEQICTACNSLSQLFYADEKIDNLVDNGGYSFYWSRNEKAPDVAKDTGKTPEGKLTMDETQIQELVKAAVTTALTGQSELVEKLEKQINELKTAPVDKSLSVGAAKEDEAEEIDPVVAFRSSMQKNIETGKGNDIIKAAVRAATNAAAAAQVSK